MIGAVAGGVAGAAKYNAKMRMIMEKYPESADDASEIFSSLDFIEEGSLLTVAIMIVAVPVGLLAGIPSGELISKIIGIESGIPVIMGSLIAIGLLWTIIWQLENIIRKKELKYLEAKYDPEFISEIRNFSKDK